MGGVHVGWFATLLDFGARAAPSTHDAGGPRLHDGRAERQLRARPVAKVGRVRAEGKVIHCGKQLATAEAPPVRPDGSLYAHATTTCLVFGCHRPR